MIISQFNKKKGRIRLVKHLAVFYLILFLGFSELLAGFSQLAAVDMVMPGSALTAAETPAIRETGDCQQTAPVYPMALNSCQLNNAEEGQIIKYIYQGYNVGNFGWMSWDGNSSVSSLTAGLIPPGNSTLYINPYNWNDHQLAAGKWVYGRWDVCANSYLVSSLKNLMNKPIIVPVWDQYYIYYVNCCCQWFPILLYRIKGFAKIQLTAFNLNCRDWISVKLIKKLGATINRRPVITSSPISSGQEQELYSYDVNAIDEDGDHLTYQLLDHPSGMAIDNSTGLIEWTPASGQAGDHSVMVRVTDEYGCDASQSFTITVGQAINHAPKITSNAILTGKEGDLYFYQVIAADEDNDPLIYSLTTAPEGMTIDSASGLASWTPSAIQAGNHAVVVRVDDNRGGTDTQSYSIQVIEFLNNAPQIISPAIEAGKEGDPYIYDIEATDADNDPLVYSLITAPEGMTIDSATGLISWIPSSIQAGNHAVAVTVDDNREGTDTQTYTIEVIEFLNNAPQITSPANEAGKEGDSYIYDIDATDADNDPLVYSLTTAPEGMTIDSASGVVSWTPSAVQAGNHAVEITVDDNRGGIASQAYAIAVSEGVNAPPTIISTPVIEGKEEIPYVYQVQATDPEQESLSYSLTQTPAGMTIDSQWGLISWTPKTAQIGENQLSVTVTDPQGLSDTQTFTIVVAGGRIDLQPKEVDVSQIQIDSQTLTMTGQVTLKILNNGNDATDYPYSLVLFEDLNGDAQFSSASDHVLAEKQFTQVPIPDQPLEISIPLRNQALFVGTVIHAWVDSNQEVPESDETNNYTNSLADCVNPPPPVGQFNPVLKWEWLGGTVKPFHRNVCTTPIVANLTDDNNDGNVDDRDIPAIVFISYANGDYYNNGVLRAIRGNGAGEIFSVSSSAFVPWSYLATGDIDQDGKVEIIGFIIESGLVKVAAFSNTGTLKWKSGETWSGVNPANFSTSIADIDQDGSPEIICGEKVFNANGSLKWKGGNGGYIGLSVVADFNLDGQPEILTYGNLYNNQGQLIWQEQGNQGAFYAVANFNDDPYPEIVSVGRGLVSLKKHTGEVIWGPVDIPPAGPTDIYSGGHPVVADFDNDGQPEIGIAGGFYYVLFETDGSIKWTQPIKDSSSGFCSAAAFDFEGDGSLEICYRDETKFRIFRGTDGLVLFETPSGSATSGDYPVIADIDNDGHAEIVVSSDNCFTGTKYGIQVYGDSKGTWVNTRNIWNQFDYCITNVNDNGSIPQYAANSWQVHNTYHTNLSPDALACVDVTSSYIRLKKIENSDNKDMIVRVGNAGRLALAKGMSVAFFAGDPQNGGTLLGVKTTATRLEVGQFEDVSVSLSQPLTGLHTIYVWADHDASGKGLHYEKDETNNISSASFNFSNQAPIITSAAVTQASEQRQYRYDVNAVDMDGDPLIYTLTSAPDGMIIDEANGVITWLPQTGTAGTYSVNVAVTDNQGASANQSFGLAVTEFVNHLPVFVSTPKTSALEKEIYYYKAQATDEDNDPIAYQLLNGPTGMEFNDQSGLVSWKPDTTQTGMHDISIEARDSFNGTAIQNFQIHVFASGTGNDYYRPVVTITVDKPIAEVNDTIHFTVSATDDSGIASIALTVHELPVTLDDQGKGQFQSAVPGTFLAKAKALDQAGLEGNAEQEIRFIHSSAGGSAPEVIITSPKEDDTLLIPTAIIGSVEDVDDDLLRYQLAYSEKDQNNFQIFATGKYCATNSVLGTLDTTQLENGIYDIRLTAEDAAGHQTSLLTQIQVQGKMKVGNFSMSFKDAEIPMAGIPISVIRTYDSRSRKVKGDFGYGWKLSTKDQLKLQESCMMGKHWFYEVIVPGWPNLPTYYLHETKNHYVTISYPDGRQEKFLFKPTIPDNPATFFETVYPAFKADSGTFSTLEVFPMIQLFTNKMADHLTYLDQSSDDSDFVPYDPTLYTLTTAEGYVYKIHPHLGLESIQDNNGNKITIEYNGIIHTGGKSVLFTRDDQGRITQIIDPMENKTIYEYDNYGDLISITDPENNKTRFVYNEDHYLTDIIDPRGIKVARNEYDDQGRLIATIDAEGNRIEYTHHIEGREEIITDRLGNPTKFIYDDNGNILQKTDAEGHSWNYTYDHDDNMLYKKDPLGNVTTCTFTTQNKMLTRTDALGNTTNYTYKGNYVESTADANGNTIKNEFDAKGNLIKFTDPLGFEKNMTFDPCGNVDSCQNPDDSIYQFGYNAGNLTSIQDPAGNITSFAYDANGKMISQTQKRTLPDGSYEAISLQSTYDKNGRLIEKIDPLGNKLTTHYNEISKPSEIIDANGLRTQFEYDSRGNLTKTIYPNGKYVTRSFDQEGRVLSESNDEGKTTTYTYDKLGRVIGITHPNGLSTGKIYDAAGNVIKEIDGNGHETVYTYNANNRKTSVTDPLGNQTTFAYDKAGNLETIIDSRGNEIKNEYDRFNRCIKTVFPDDTYSTVTYNNMGQKTQTRDRQGNITQFTYDSVGNLEMVTDALGHTFTYQYNELKQLITQTDANGHSTRFEYNTLGNRTKRILPMGMFETYQYDNLGKLLAHTDFNGQTISFEYDEWNRVIRKKFPTGPDEEFVYDSMGQLEKIIDKRGTTLFEYNEWGQVIKRTDPDGLSVSYTYDNTGKKQSVTVPSGSTSFVYDSYDRLAEVINPQGGVTEYSYDSYGNRSGMVYPNGSHVAYAYDPYNRLTSFIHKKSSGEIISSYQYTLSAEGKTMQVVDHQGRVVNYMYDPTYKLLEEKINDPQTGQRLIQYSYDHAGNILTKTENDNVIDYSYDDNDRLLQVGSVTYAYDNNGNMLSSDENGALTTYQYDYQNRLVQVNKPEGASSVISKYEYDASGIRVGQSVNNVTTRYLVDHSQPFAQVLEERSQNGDILASYVYGDDLISQKRGGSWSFYHYDGNLSTRQLTDMSENVTDTYTYDAFGNLIQKTGNTENNYLYSGEQFDPNLGFYYLRARYYSPQQGRFTAFDSYEGEITDPASLHKYAYAANDPVNNCDPSGNMTLVQLEARFAISMVLANIVTGAYFSLTAPGGPSFPNAAALNFTVSAAAFSLKWGILATMFTGIISNSAALDKYFKPYFPLFLLSALATLGTNTSSGVSAGIEIVADADSRKLQQFFFFGSKVNLGYGNIFNGEIGSINVSFNSTVIWNLDKLDSYKEDAISAMCSVGRYSWGTSSPFPAGDWRGMIWGFGGGLGGGKYGFDISHTFSKEVLSTYESHSETFAICSVAPYPWSLYLLFRMKHPPKR